MGLEATTGSQRTREPMRMRRPQVPLADGHRRWGGHEGQSSSFPWKASSARGVAAVSTEPAAGVDIHLQGAGDADSHGHIGNTIARRRLALETEEPDREPQKQETNDGR